MKHCNNRLAMLGAVAISVLAAAPREAMAQLPVTDVAGSAQWVQQTLTQIKTLAQQAQSYGGAFKSWTQVTRARSVG